MLAGSRYVGQKGQSVRTDMTDEMLELANNNKERMGAANVEFLKGLSKKFPFPIIPLMW